MISRKFFDNRRKPIINEEFKPKNPMNQEPVPSFGYFLNIDCVIDKEKL